MLELSRKFGKRIQHDCFEFTLLLEFKEALIDFLAEYVHTMDQPTSLGILLNIGDEKTNFGYPISGTAILRIYHSRITYHVKGKMVVALGGKGTLYFEIIFLFIQNFFNSFIMIVSNSENLIFHQGKDSYLQANGINFNFVNEIKSYYDFTTTTVGTTAPLHPATKGAHGLYAHIKREENVIRFVKSTSCTELPSKSVNEEIVNYSLLLVKSDTEYLLASSNYMVALIPNQVL